MSAYVEAPATRQKADDDGRQESDSERRANHHRDFNQALVRFLSSVCIDGWVYKSKFKEFFVFVT